MTRINNTGKLGNSHPYYLVFRMHFYVSVGLWEIYVTTQQRFALQKVPQLSKAMPGWVRDPAPSRTSHIFILPAVSPPLCPHP